MGQHGARLDLPRAEEDGPRAPARGGRDGRARAWSGPDGLPAHPDGETEFQILLAKSLAEYDDSAQAVYGLAAAVTFLTTLPRARAISLLRHRVTQMEGSRAAVRGVLEHGVDWGHPRHVTELYRLWDTSLEAVLGCRCRMLSTA